MRVIGDYHANGYAQVEELILEPVARAFMNEIKTALGEGPIPLSKHGDHPKLLKRAAFEAYGYHFRPMLFFLWGLTPIVSQLVGRRLLPTYDYFRIYREGDVCRVHSDRYSCEHSLSLTLDYSDGVPWDLEIETVRTEPSSRVEEDFGKASFAAVPMKVGDAVLYQGVHHRHARTKPNPNAWSAHLFLHWVDEDGPYRDAAFDGRGKLRKVDFSFA